MTPYPPQTDQRLLASEAFELIEIRAGTLGTELFAACPISAGTPLFTFSGAVKTPAQVTNIGEAEEHVR